MITEDYILRLIRLASAFVIKALGLAKEGDFLESEKTMENGLQDLTGISLDTLITLDASALEGIFGGDDASVFVLAEFLQTIAEVERLKGSLDLYYIHMKKSLELYLSIRVNEDYKTVEPILKAYAEVKEVIYDADLIEKLVDFFNDRKGKEEIVYLKSLLKD